MSITNGHAPTDQGDTEFFGYFAAGPSKLPDEVLRKAQQELTSYKTSRVSVMELSHR